jgi:hypothetical protein
MDARIESTTRSNQRPDTLMQERIYRIVEIFLHRTAEPLNVSRSSPQ